MRKKSHAGQYPASPHMLKAIDVVDIVRTDRSTVIAKGPNVWATWFEGKKVSKDFMLERDQPDSQ